MLFEDLTLGAKLRTELATLTREDISDFAKLYDPQPMHLSDAGAAGTLFGEQVASGWHVAGVTMRLVVQAKPLGETPLIGVEVRELAFRRAAPVGITLYCDTEILALEPSSRPERGYVLLGVETKDASDDAVVMRQIWKLIAPRR